MLGWIVAVILWFAAAFCFWKTQGDPRVKKLPVNAKWLFGIFIFLSVFDVWTSFFMIIWLGIAIEANPVFGEDLTLPVAIFAKAGQILCIYFSLKYSSIRIPQQTFNKASVFAYCLCCAVMFLAAVNNEICFYRAVYQAVSAGFLY